MTTDHSTFWHAALRRYLAVILAGNLVWEFAHMPLYQIGWAGTWREIVFAAVHCTGGDVLIALTTMIGSLLVLGNGFWPKERLYPVAVLTILLSLAYTIFSEWLNIVIKASWAYSEWMPVLALFGFDVGLSPLFQWIIIPIGGFWFATRTSHPAGSFWPTRAKFPKEGLK